MKREWILVVLLIGVTGACAYPAEARVKKKNERTPPPADLVVKVDPAVQKLQDEFLKLKFGMFCCYNMRSFERQSKEDWVPGYRSPAEFDPGVETIDTDSWADAAKSAGMKYGVLTVKHSTGFCLWDSKYTTYDVMHPDCPYKKDIVAQFIKSFKSRGLKPALYYLWRNPKIDDNPKTSGLICLPPECDPRTHSVEEQMEFHKKQIAELLEKYPDVFYIWHDGLDPTIGPADEVLAGFKKIRPDVIHCANWWDHQKKGWPYTDIAVTENFHFWEDNKFPGETCWMLEQHWFHHSKNRTKDAKEMVQHVRTANSRNANFLLNAAPDKTGTLLPSSVKALAEIGRMLADSENKPE